MQKNLGLGAGGAVNMYLASVASDLRTGAWGERQRERDRQRKR